jgi:hypothetical protein
MSQYRTHECTDLRTSMYTRNCIQKCHHHSIYSDDSKCTSYDDFTYDYQVPFEQGTEKHTSKRTVMYTHSYILTYNPQIHL